MKLRTFRIGGVHPEENKLSSESVTQVAKLPQQAIFPLSQHIGAPAKPVVKKGKSRNLVGRGWRICFCTCIFVGFGHSYEDR